MTIHLGYEIGSGRAISIPAGHLCVTGQSQKSGKTTTLEALITRSKKKAVAFVTKRGEGSFKVAHPVLPYFDDDLSKREDGWLFVQRLLEAALEQKLKDTTPYVIEAVAGAKNLLDVADKVTAMLSKGAAAEASGKRFNKADRRAWMCLQAYFSVIMPELRRLPRSNKFALHAGLNVMDLGEYSPQTQMMVVASVLNHVSQKESNVISVIPEAWEFVPQVGTSPVSAVAEDLARKGAALGNFVWFDSQDIAGVDKMLFRNVSVWLFGVQRETNELERTLKSIPNLGRRPRLEDLTTLKKGEFIVCFDANIHKVYVQPAWMGETHAQAIATGDMDVASAREVEKTWDREHKPQRREIEGEVHDNYKTVDDAAHSAPSPSVELELARASLADANSEIERLRGNIAVMKSEIGYLRETQAGPINKQFASEGRAGLRATPALDRPLDALLPENGSNTAEQNRIARLGSNHRTAENPRPTLDLESGMLPPGVEDHLINRLIQRAVLDPVILEVIVTRPELRVTIKRETVLATSDTAQGVLALMIRDGFFAAPQNGNQALKEIQRRGRPTSARNAYRECDALAEMGFLTKESAGYLAVPGMKMFIEETKSDGGNTKCQK